MLNLIKFSYKNNQLLNSKYLSLLIIMNILGHLIQYFQIFTNKFIEFSFKKQSTNLLKLSMQFQLKCIDNQWFILYLKKMICFTKPLF